MKSLRTLIIKSLTAFKQPQLWRALLFSAIIIVLCVVTSICIPQSSIQALLDWSGAYADLAYLAIFTLLPILFFPVAVLASCAGITFGFIKATILTMIGIVLNASIMFFIARHLAQAPIIRLINRCVSSQTLNAMQSYQQRQVALTFFLLRLIPLVSFNLLNYLGGITRMRYRTYLLTTIVGTFPGTVVYINMACQSSNAGSTSFLFSILLIVLLICVPTVFAYCWRGGIR